MIAFLRGSGGTPRGEKLWLLLHFSFQSAILAGTYRRKAN
jgi:hypothetical protein